MDKISEAKEYGRLITMRGRFVEVLRIRLYDNHQHNWHQNIISNGMINIPTDQTAYYESNHQYKLNKYDEVWFEGVRIFKKPLLIKMLHSIKNLFSGG